MARAGLAIATYGATEALNTAGDKFAESMSKDLEAASDAFWKREDGRRAAMAEFRTALTALTDPGEDGTPQKKLVIVIDELDRCRPDYALQLLEVIKHFFATPGIHFVLGVNLHELANSVRARYGAGIDAERYLHKFVQIRMPMKPAKSVRGKPGEASDYFERVVGEMSINQLRSHYTHIYITMVNHHFDVTFRDIQKIATLLAVIPMRNLMEEADHHLLAGLTIMQVLRPDWISKARLGQLAWLDVGQLFKFEQNKDAGQFFEDAHWSWRLALTRDPLPDPLIAVKQRLSDSFVSRERFHAIPDIIANSLDAFELPN